MTDLVPAVPIEPVLDTAVAERLAMLTGHGLRSGLATESCRAGHDAKTIATQGGWRPNSAEL